LHDYERAIHKIEWFRSQFKGSSEHNSQCDALRSKVYLCAPKQSSNALISIEKALGKKTMNQVFTLKDFEKVRIYSRALVTHGNFYKALKVQQRLLSEVILPSKMERSPSLLQIGLIFSKLGKTDSCLHYLNESFKYAIQEENDTNLAQSSFELGMFLRFTKNKKEALNYLLKSFNRILLLEDAQRLKLCRVIGEMYKLESNSENALKFKELELKYSDSLKSAEKARLDAEYSYELSTKRERQQDTQEAYNNASKRIKWGVFCGIIFFFFFLFLLVRSKRKRALPNESVALETIVQQLKEPGTELPIEKEKIIHDLLSNLQQSVSGKKWEEFEKGFNMEYPEFLSKLEKSHSKLSTNERKLCMCLSQNLSTKEIAPITGQNAHAINIARGRLRKKLGIDYQDIPISDYLSQFL
jgi:tetratricopeptide (TPR) repeat protein